MLWLPGASADLGAAGRSRSLDAGQRGGERREPAERGARLAVDPAAHSADFSEVPVGTRCAQQRSRRGRDRNYQRFRDSSCENLMRGSRRAARSGSSPRSFALSDSGSGPLSSIVRWMSPPSLRAQRCSRSGPPARDRGPVTRAGLLLRHADSKTDQEGPASSCRSPAACAWAVPLEFVRN